MFNWKRRNQILSTICATLLAISYGGTCGWPSPSLPVLQSNETPLESGPISLEEGSWMTSIMAIGGTFGTIFFGWIAGKYGRKLPLLSLAIPQIISWTLIAYAFNPLLIYIGRFISGFFGAGVYVLLPLYVAEISDNKIRGFLGSLIVLTTNIGYVIVFTIGNFYNYKVYSILMSVFPLMFFILFFYFPETPHSLLRKGNELGAEKSLSFYRNISSNSNTKEVNLLKEEFEKLKNEINPLGKVDIYSDRLTINDFNYPVARKAFLIGIVLMILAQFNGVFAMENYTVQIFAEAGSTLTPNVSTIIVGIIQLLGTCVSTNFVETAGRRFLIGISAAGSGIGVGVFAIYSFYQFSGFDVESYRWVPLVSLSFAVFITNCGVLNIPFVVIPEVMPERIRSFGTTVCLVIVWILAFIMLKFFPIASAAFGIHICLLAFSICSFAGSAFVFLVMPETKGKSFDEIMKLLGGK